MDPSPLRLVVPEPEPLVVLVPRRPRRAHLVLRYSWRVLELAGLALVGAALVGYLLGCGP